MSNCNGSCPISFISIPKVNVVLIYTSFVAQTDVVMLKMSCVKYFISFSTASIKMQHTFSSHMQHRACPVCCEAYIPTNSLAT